MSEHRNRSSPGNGSNKAIDNITSEELVEFREAFRVFDQDGDVRIKEYPRNLSSIFIFQGSITLAGGFQMHKFSLNNSLDNRITYRS